MPGVPPGTAASSMEVRAMPIPPKRHQPQFDLAARDRCPANSAPPPMPRVSTAKQRTDVLLLPRTDVRVANWSMFSCESAPSAQK